MRDPEWTSEICCRAGAARRPRIGAVDRVRGSGEDAIYLTLRSWVVFTGNFGVAK